MPVFMLFEKLLVGVNDVNAAESIPAIFCKSITLIIQNNQSLLCAITLYWSVIIGSLGTLTDNLLSIL
jgi:hypothetical protein